MKVYGPPIFSMTVDVAAFAQGIEQARKELEKVAATEQRKRPKRTGSRAWDRWFAP